MAAPSRPSPCSVQREIRGAALRERAVKRLKKRRDFYGHILVYLLVNAFLVVAEEVSEDRIRREMEHLAHR